MTKKEHKGMSLSLYTPHLLIRRKSRSMSINCVYDKVVEFFLERLQYS